MKKNYLIRFFAALIVFALIFTCFGSITEADAAPAAAPASAAVLADVQPVGWYRSINEGDSIKVYLSTKQGQWSIGTYSQSCVSVASIQSTNSDFAAFSITPEGAGSGSVEFVCESGGLIVSRCSFSCYVNESYSLDVTKADIGTTALDVFTGKKLAYKLDYRRYSPFLYRIVGKNVLSDARIVINAFLRHQTSAKVSSRCRNYGYMNKLAFALEQMCPPYSALTDFNQMKAYRSGRLRWKYLYSRSRTASSLKKFESIVKKDMSLLYVKDTQTARAMILYNALTENAAYDYDYMRKKVHTVDESRSATSVYNAIVNKKGICTSFAGALNFLYEQIGINSIEVNGKSPTMDHAWTLAKLDGKNYYFDPTWDVGGGFKYFGISMNDRTGWAGGFTKSTIAICGKKAVSGAYKVISTRFSALHDALNSGYASFEFDHASQTASFAGGTITFPCGQ